MDQMPYKVSICIPTYNREKYLKRLIDSIIHQNWFSNEIQIIINDWPSIDSTELMVNNYQKKFSNIRYYRNNVAIWMMPAILESISFSNWKYTWLFWSDDVMSKDALQKTLFVINSISPKIIISDRLVFSKEHEYECLELKPIDNINFKGFKEFWKYLWDSSQWTVEEKSNYFTFMSIFCFETDYFKKCLNIIKASNDFDKFRLKINYFNYIYILYSSLYDQDIISLLRNNMVFAQSDNCWWKGNNNILEDMKWLFNFLILKYELDDNCNKLFKRIFRSRKIAILISKYILNLRIVQFAKNNNYTSYIYKNISKFIIKIISVFS